MSDCTLPRITEKQYIIIPPVPITADGTVDGVITVASTYCFKVGQKVLFIQGSDRLLVKIQRVISETQFIAIDASKSIITHDKLDMSSFLSGSTVSLIDNNRLNYRPTIDLNEISRQIYEEEPTVAIRSHMVDWLGRSYCIDNPMPVQLSDGSVEIGTVNAELEVQLSHQDNVPDVGDVADSVQIGDGTETLEINPDGSINVVGSFATINRPNAEGFFLKNIATSGTEVSFTFPDNTKYYKIRVRKSKDVVKLGLNAGDIAAGNYWTISKGNIYSPDHLNDFPNSYTLYFDTNSKNDVDLEIQHWYKV